MSNFKTGDKVIYLGDSLDQVTGGVPKIVYSVSPCGKYLRVRRDDTDGFGGYYATDFVLVGEQGDELPPAPESVRYYHRGYHGIHADAYLDVHSGHFASGPRIRINDKDNRGITIDANAALQLAHDLTRMAMELKRKEKQDVI